MCQLAVEHSKHIVAIIYYILHRSSTSASSLEQTGAFSGVFLAGPNVPTVIVAVNFAKVPKKRPKLCARGIRERDGNRCQYTGRLLHPDEGSLDHVLPRSRGGQDTWENLVWAAKEVNQRKADRLPHEAGLKLLTVPRARKELPATALLRNAHGVADWRLFVK